MAFEAGFKIDVGGEPVTVGTVDLFDDTGMDGGGGAADADEVGVISALLDAREELGVLRKARGGEEREEQSRAHSALDT